METWKDKKSRLWDMRDDRVMIASHRGKFSSSVMENTTLAFLTALNQGADMVELDLEKTADGKLVGHHDPTMERLFHVPGKISDYTLDELKKMEIYNYLGEPCEEGIESLDEMLAAMKDRAILVLDKCWDDLDDIYQVLKHHQMLDQVIIKFYIQDDKTCVWAAAHPDCSYIPMLRDTSYLPRLAKLKRETPVPALEILPKKETDAVFQKETFDWLKNEGMKVWCNSLSLSKRLIYGAGNDDLKSLRYGGDKGWGELIRRGVRVIQTDWPFELKNYLDGIR